MTVQLLMLPRSKFVESNESCSMDSSGWHYSDYARYPNFTRRKGSVLCFQIEVDRVQ